MKTEQEIREEIKRLKNVLETTDRNDIRQSAKTWIYALEYVLR